MRHSRADVLSAAQAPVVRKGTEPPPHAVVETCPHRSLTLNMSDRKHAHGVYDLGICSHCGKSFSRKPSAQGLVWVDAAGVVLRRAAR